MENKIEFTKNVEILEGYLQQAHEIAGKIEEEAKRIVHTKKGWLMYRRWFIILLFFMIWVSSPLFYPNFKKDFLVIFTVYGLLYLAIQRVSDYFIKRKELSLFTHICQQHQSDFKPVVKDIDSLVEKINSLQSQITPFYYRKSFLEYMESHSEESMDNLIEKYDYEHMFENHRIEEILLIHEKKNDLEVSKSLVVSLISQYTSIELSDLI